MSAACHFADEEVTMKFSAPAKENHFALWNWLAKNPEENRIDWPGWETMQRLSVESPLSHCWLCEAYRHCNGCPLAAGAFTCAGAGGLYSAWCKETDPARRTALAIQIRDAWK